MKSAPAARRLLPTLPFTVLGVFAGAVTAAETPPDELELITVTATRLPTPVADVPATVSVITAARMANELVENIEDLVRYEPGVSVRTSPARFTAAGASTGRDGHSGFNIRGLDGNRVLIQVDGVRTPDAFSFGAQSVGRGDYVDLGLLKSVEILRGPASALYGSDGVAGAVSFFTKDPEDFLKERNGALRFGAAWGDANSNLTYSALGAGRWGGWEALASYVRRDGEGQETQGMNDSANTDRTTANPEDNHSNAALVKLVRRLTDQQRLRLTWDHLDGRTDWDVLSAIAKPPLAATSVVGLTAFDTMRRDRFALDHAYENEGGAVRALQTSLYYQSSQTRQYSAEDRNTAADRIRDAYFDNDLWGLSLQARSDFAGTRASHVLVYGGDYSVTRQENLRDGTVPPVGETFPSRAFPSTDYTLAGVYLQDEVTWNRLTLIPALRWDYFRNEPRADALYTASVPAGQSGSQLSPKLGLLFRFTEAWSVFLNGATGFKAPAPGQVNTGFSNPVANYTSIPNPDLQPETSRTLEAGLRHEGQRWSASVTGYTGSYDDFIDQVQVGGNFTPTDPAIFQFVNLQQASIYGVEARGRVLLTEGLAWTVSGAWSRGSSERNGVSTPLASIDPLQVVSGLDWTPAALPVGLQLMGTWTDRKDASRIGISCTGGCYIPSDSLVFDLLARWQIGTATTLRAGVFNLTDEHYTNWADVRGLSDTSVVKDAYTQPGRNFSVSATIAF